MNASKFILLAGLSAIITAEFSFAQNTPTPTAKVEPDPVKSFEKLVTTFPTTKWILKAGSTQATCQIVDVSFDVKKTDSLMNPVIGVINFTIDETISRPGGHVFHSPLVMQMVFNWQGGRWTFGRLLNRGNGIDFTNTSGGKEILEAGPMSEFLKSLQ